MNTRQTNAFTMGPTFVQWERLTDEYQKGLEALRRGDAGASVLMARLADKIQRLNQRYSSFSPFLESAT